MYLLEIGMECPLVGDPNWHDGGKSVERVRPSWTLGAFIDKNASRDPGDVTVGEHRSRWGSFLDEVRELPNDRNLEASHLPDHPDCCVLQCFSGLAGVAWQRRRCLERTSEWMDQDDLASFCFDDDKSPVIVEWSPPLTRHLEMVAQGRVDVLQRSARLHRRSTGGSTRLDLHSQAR